LFIFLTGEKSPILWSFAEKKNGQLFWCFKEDIGFDENYNSTVPIAVQGDTDKPFILVSFPGPEPNLHAVAMNENLNVTQIGCMFNKVYHHRIIQTLEHLAKNETLFSASKYASSFFRPNKFV